MRLLNRLKERRQQRGLTQEALASSVQVTRQSIIAIEKGKFVPSVRLALLIAHALGMGIEELFWLDSRALVSAAIGCLIWAAGGPWWTAVVVGVLSLAFFGWAKRSGRYAVAKGTGIAPLRRDEYGQSLTDRAGRMGFAAMMLAVAGLAIYYGIVAHVNVPVLALVSVVVLGWIAYFGADLWLRHAA